MASVRACRGGIATPVRSQPRPRHGWREAPADVPIQAGALQADALCLIRRGGDQRSATGGIAGARMALQGFVAL